MTNPRWMERACKVVSDHRLCAPNSYTPQADDGLLSERIAAALEQAVREEREACAQTVEDYRLDKYGRLDGASLLNAAAFIRARSEAEGGT